MAKDRLAGLGVERFAGARKSTYDKRVRQARETALNAKKVNKYRKLLRSLEPSTSASPPQRAAEPAHPSNDDEGIDAPVRQKWGQRRGGVAEASVGTTTSSTSEAAKPAKKAKGRPQRKTQLQRIAEKVAAGKAEQERQSAEEERNRKRFAEEKASHQKARKKMKSKFLKRTKSGQPVMKHRVDKILEELQQEGKQ